MYGSVAITVESKVEGAEGAGVVELGEIDLVGEVGGTPVALLGGVPAYWSKIVHKIGAID